MTLFVNRSGVRRRLKRGLSALVMLVLFRGDQVAAQAPRTPQLDKTLNAVVPQRGANFGYTMVMGKVGGANDLRDDVVACAINEDYPTLGAANGIDIGVSSPFVDELLSLHASYQTLLPSVQQSNLQLGRLRPAIGDVRGGQPNRVFLGAWQREQRYFSCDPPVSIPGLGSVEIYDLQSTSSALIKTLLPPADPGTCAPLMVRGFGIAMVIADVDGDGYKDLCVGALNSDTGIGRVYVFFGHPAFDQVPDLSWVAIKGPVGGGEGTSFGNDVGADDLDGDGRAELIVGRPERSVGPGRVYLISGDWIATQTRNAVHDLPAAPSSAFQVLVNPLDPDQDAFGFRVYALGDVGSHPLAAQTQLDGLADVAIHGEGTRVGGVNNAGALFVYFNNGDGVLGAPFVNDTPGTRLFFTAPAPPQDGARFGRGAARIRWPIADGTLSDYILVSEPDADVLAALPSQPDVTATFTDAGRIWMFALPLTTTSTPALPLPITEPEIASGNVFGGEIVVGDYLNNPLFPGQQFLASGRSTGAGNPVQVGAGKVYSFRPTPPGP